MLFCHIDGTLQRREVLQSAISYCLKMPGILLMSFSRCKYLYFLSRGINIVNCVFLKTSTFVDIVIVFRCLSFSISVSISFNLFIILYALTNMLLSVPTEVIIIIIPCKFIPPPWADGFSLKLEWEQVYSSLQDSAQYSGWSQKCSSWDGLCTSSDFRLFQPQFQAFGDCSECTSYNWYTCHFQVP